VGSVRRRLEALEERIPLPKPPDRTEARARMKARLDQVAKLRRGELSDQETAELEAVRTALGSQITKRRAGHE